MVDSLPYEMRQEYCDVFGLFDKRGDGYLTKNEFQSLLKSLDPRMDTQEIKEFMGITGLEHMPEIHINPFTEAMIYKMKQVNPIDEIKKAFEVFDPDMKGKIGVAELQQSMTIIGDAWFTPEEIDIFIEEAERMSEEGEEGTEIDYNKLAEYMYKMCLSSESKS